MFTLTYEIEYDGEYTRQLQEKVAANFPNVQRNATHVSDLYGCLLKAWLKLRISKDQWIDGGEDDPLLMWQQGLQFEALVSEGQRQRVTAYCFKCRAVSSPIRNSDGSEQATCPVCEQRVLYGTPDYIVVTEAGHIIHESKQTRMSQRNGPGNAPWWIEQLAMYILFERRRTNGQGATWGRIVANWLMGDYGNSKAGTRRRPPRSELDAFRIKFPDSDEFWNAWEGEVLRRQQIVDGDVRPEVVMSTDSPRWSWECSSCPVGKAGECSNYIWDDEGNEIGYVPRVKKGKKLLTSEEAEEEAQRWAALKENVEEKGYDVAVRESTTI